jgi:very-short-patch-repair endonuclease
VPRQKERYCIKLVSDALGGTKYQEQHQFDFLRGEPTTKRPNGIKLRVDAYYPDFGLILEFREGQHYIDGKSYDFWNKKRTAIGVDRKTQRLMYDKKRETVLPANGYKLLIIYDNELTTLDWEKDIKVIKQKLRKVLN